MAKRKVKQVPISLTLTIAELAEALKHLGASVKKPGKYGAHHYTELLLVDFDGKSINSRRSRADLLPCRRLPGEDGRSGAVLLPAAAGLL